MIALLTRPKTQNSKRETRKTIELPTSRRARQDALRQRFTLSISEPVPFEELPAFARTLDRVLTGVLDIPADESGSAVIDIVGCRTPSQSAVILAARISLSHGTGTILVRLSSRGHSWKLVDFAITDDLNLPSTLSIHSAPALAA